MQELGFTSWFSRSMTLENSLGHLAAAGCHEVEIAAMGEYLPRWRSIRATLEKKNMSVSTVSLGVPFYYSDGKYDLHSRSRTIREATLNFVRMSIDFASRIDAPLIYACSMNRGHHDDRGRTLEILSESVAHCAAYAEQAGVRFAIEPFPSGELRTTLETAAFIEDSGAGNLGLVLDTGHAAIAGESLREAILTSFRYIAHLHLNNNDGKRDLHWPPQYGKLEPLDFEEALSSLREKRYLGKMSVELSRPRPVVGKVLESRTFVEAVVRGLGSR